MPPGIGYPDPIEELIRQVTEQARMGAPAVSNGLPVSAPPAAPPGVQTPVQGISEIDRLLQVVSPEPLGKGQRFGLAAVDALNALLAVRQGRPTQGPVFTQQALEQRRGSAREATEANLRKASVLSGRESEATRQRERQEDITLRGRERAEEQQTARDRIAAETDLLKRRQIYDEEQARLDRQLRERLAREDRQSADKVLERQIAGEQRDALKHAKALVVGLKNQIPALLAGAEDKPAMTPDQIMESALDDLDAIGLEGESKEIAEAFLELKIGPALEEARLKASAPPPQRKGLGIELPLGPLPTGQPRPPLRLDAGDVMTGPGNAVVGLLELLRGVEDPFSGIRRPGARQE